MRRQTRTPALSALSALLALLMLGGCQPSYNWREIHGSDAGYRVLLPAKPVSMQRPIDLDGMAVTMSMTGARIDETTFTVGSVELPGDDENLRAHATGAMRTAMERNVQGHETSVSQVEVPVVDAGGRALGNASGTHVEVEGRVRGEPSHMSATFVAYGTHAWQAVVIAPVADPPAARLFHESFRIVQ